MTELPGGEETLRLRLADLRAKVEQARLVRQKLVLAEAALDRRLEAAGRRRAEVGFVRDAVVDAGRELRTSALLIQSHRCLIKSRRLWPRCQNYTASLMGWIFPNMPVSLLAGLGRLEGRHISRGRSGRPSLAIRRVAGWTPSKLQLQRSALRRISRPSCSTSRECVCMQQ